MEYRKIIGFGRSSFIVSLPKSWITKNKLKKGDLVYLEEKDGGIVFYPKEKENNTNNLREFFIDITGKDIIELNRHLIPAYINNFNSIKIKGMDLTLKSKQVKEILSELMALEIMDETSDTILARDFISMKKVNIPTLIRKMDNISRTMISDSIKMINRPDILKSLTERDKNINRLSYLVFRCIKYGLNNPTAAKSYNLNNEELLKLWLLASKIESIADEVKRIGVLLTKHSANTNQVKDISRIYTKIEDFYKNNLKGYYSKDFELLYKCVGSKKTIIKDLDALQNKNPDVEYLPNILERMKTVTGQINSIAWLMFGR